MEVHAFKMLLAGVLPRCAKVESEKDERRRRAVATKMARQLAALQQHVADMLHERERGSSWQRGDAIRTP